MVVTAAAGGVTDVVARALAQHLSEAWKQQVIVENRGGAAHSQAMTVVARSAADGYTLMVAEAGGFVINPAIYPKGKLEYDEKKDFAPVTGLVKINQALLASTSLPVSNVKELIALAKAKPRRDHLRHRRHRLGAAHEHRAARKHGGGKIPGGPLSRRSACAQ